MRDSEVPNIGYWTDPNAWIEWSVKYDKPGTYEVTGDVSVEAAKTQFQVGMPQKLSPVEVESTGGYGNYKKKSFGTITIEKAGTYPLQIIPEPKSWQPMNLRTVQLKLQ